MVTPHISEGRSRNPLVPRSGVTLSILALGTLLTVPLPAFAQTTTNKQLLRRPAEENLPANLRVIGRNRDFIRTSAGKNSSADRLRPSFEAPACCNSESHTATISARDELYELPDVQLISSHGAEVHLADLVNHHGPVVLQFAFTTCSTVCPVLSSTTAEVQKRLAKELGKDAEQVRFVTISIDPQHDSPAVLKEYAESLEAREGWHFLTGKPAEVAAVRKAFKAYTFNKSRHEALTFLLAGSSRPERVTQSEPPPSVTHGSGSDEPDRRAKWIRITGFLSAEELTTRIQKLIDQSKPGDPKLGKRIYREGILPDGSKLTALVSGDVPIRGRFASCAKCHRNSGYGSDEPGKIVPATTGPRLFASRRHNRAEELRSLFQEPQTSDESTAVRIPRNRPAYTEASLLAALREGHDPTGYNFGPLKPRYDLSDENGRHLIAYLKTLGTDHPPGVEDDTIHFATIITDDVSPAAQTAFLQTITAFVETKNREVARYRARPGISPHYKSDLIPSFRRWQVHVWRLEGSPANYGLQLASNYDRTPVFAILSGLSEGDWRPIHRFCDHREIPCIVPITPLPEQDAAGGYTIYFDRGKSSNSAETNAANSQSLKAGNAGHQWQRIHANRLPRSYRVKGWFRARGVKLTHPDLQLRTHFGLTVSAHALGHMIERHSRDYFMERIEHETENALNPGTHPTLSLGPGQRFASGDRR